MGMIINIRKGKPEDFEAIYLLLHQLWPGKELHKDNLERLYRNGLESHQDDYFCAEADGRVAGFCSVWYKKNSFWQEGCLGYIGELVVDQPLRKQGIGKELLNTLFKQALQKGCHRVELDSAFSRVEASEFYLKMGFDKRANLFTKVL
jgi:GNAT superfamily N-acetyltransferase